MNENQNIKDIDLSKITISQLRWLVNSIYGMENILILLNMEKYNEKL